MPTNEASASRGQRPDNYERLFHGTGT